MNLLNIRDHYLEYSKSFKSSGTYRYDKSHLTSIIDYLINHDYTEVKSINFKALYDFIDESRLAGNSNATINKRIALLKQAIVFQVKLGECEPSIIAAFPKLKEIDKRFDIVSENAMIKIINYMMKLDNSFVNLRNKCIIFLFIDSGIRLSEMTAIKTENIDFESGSILLSETKSKRERIVYFSDTTKKYMERYLDKINDESKYFFRNSKDESRAINYLAVIRVMHKIRDDLGLKKLSSHMIRHSYGTLAYKLNISTLFTKNTMGHSRVEMTERYTHYDIETNRRIYESLSPMDYYSRK